MMARLARLWWRGLIVLLAVLAVLVLAAWLWRRPLAGLAVEHFAKARGLALKLDVQALGLHGARLGNVRLGDGLVLRQVALRWSRKGWRQFTLKQVEMDGARVRVRVRDGHIQIGDLALPTLGGSATSPAPDLSAIALSVRHGQLVLDLPQGAVTTSIFAHNAPDGSWTFALKTEPAQLRDQLMHMALRSFDVAGHYRQGIVEAKAQAALGPGYWDGASARAGSRDGRNSWQQAHLVFSCTCDVRDAKTPAGDVHVSAQVQGLQTPKLSAQSGRIRLDLKGKIRTSAMLDAVQARGQIELHLDHGKAGATLFSALPDPAALPADIAPFAAALEQALRRAAADFSADASLALSARDGALMAEGGRASLKGAPATQSQVQISLDTARYGRKTGAWGFDGAMQARLGNVVPRARIERLSVRKLASAPLAFSADRVDMAAVLPARHLFVQAQTLSGQFARQHSRLQALLKVRWQGPFSALRFRKAAMDGPVRLQQGPDGLWQVFIPEKTLRLRAGQISAGAWRVEHVRTMLRARATRPLARLDKSGFKLDAPLANVSADLRKNTMADFLVQMRSHSGRLKARFAAKDKASAALNLARLSVNIPGEQGKYLRIKKLDASARSRAGRWRGDGALQETQYDSDGLPAHVLAKTVPFVFSLDKNGLDMRALKLQFVVNSTDRPAIYPPLTVRLDTRLADGSVTGKGAILLARDGTYLSDLQLVHDLATSKGVASGSAQSLHFGSHDLKFTELMPSFIGLVANAEGSPTGAFTAKWDASGLGETTGSVDINGMNFDVLLGRVEKVTGHIDFSSLLPLTTNGAARVHIGTLDPGIALKDGEVVFALVEDGGLRIDKAAWPFAGGRLHLKPMLWKIGGLDQKAELKIENADILQLASLFGFSDLSAEGMLSGTLPLEITDTTMFVHDGLLKAPVPGILRYHSAVGDNASGAAPQAAMAFDVLKNLHFKRLEMRLDGDVGGDMTASMVLEGNNPEVVYGVPFRLNITTTAAFTRLAAQATSGLRIGQNIQRLIENSNAKAPEK